MGKGFIDVRGTRQWLLIRGRDRSNEVVLFLHGGPGSPVTGLAGTWYQGALEDWYVVVHWEQRGAGKSYHAGRSGPLDLETYVADALEVTDWLRSTFGKEKIYLVGHSYGGLLGAHLAARYPDRYHALLAVAPLVDATRQEQLSAAYVRDFYARRGDLHAVARLERFGNPPYADPYRAVMAERWLLARTPGFTGPGWPLRSAHASELLASPHYSLRDLAKRLPWFSPEPAAALHLRLLVRGPQAHPHRVRGAGLHPGGCETTRTHPPRSPASTSSGCAHREKSWSSSTERGTWCSSRPRRASTGK